MYGRQGQSLQNGSKFVGPAYNVHVVCVPDLGNVTSREKAV